MRCQGITSKGERCKRTAQVSGYCINHISSYEKQPVTHRKQPILKYMEEVPLTWEDLRNCKNRIKRLKLLQKYHSWIRLKRNQDKLQKKRDANKDYRERIKLKGLKKS